METKITTAQSGSLPSGENMHEYTLSNQLGITVKLGTYGARILSIKTPNRSGIVEEICAGFDSPSDYYNISQYFGAVVGRVANRIRDGKFTLEGKEYQLWTDASGEHLHGGKQGFSDKLWRSAVDGNRIRFDYQSPDGEENYPGALSVIVWYTLEQRDLTIEYEATTDATTIINLTNHAFFNLNSFKTVILDHQVRLQADSYTPVDKRLIPTGEIAPVAGTPFDFTTPIAISENMKVGSGVDGFDHNFVFSRTNPDAVEWLAEVTDPTSGRTLAMATTEPCVQFYTGNFFDGTVSGYCSHLYRKYDAFCLEAQKHPDAINHPNFASIILRPGQVYRQKTIYRFGVVGS